MKPVETLAKLEHLGHPLFETRDLAALLGVANSSATRAARMAPSRRKRMRRVPMRREA